MRRGKNKCVHVELDDVSGTLPSSTGQQDAGKKNIMGESNNKKRLARSFPFLQLLPFCSSSLCRYPFISVMPSMLDCKRKRNGTGCFGICV